MEKCRKMVISHNELDSLLGPDVCDIVFNASKMNLYVLGALPHSDKFVIDNDSIAGYAVAFKQEIQKRQSHSLLFVISDSCFYSKGYMPVKQPFYPYLAIEFAKKKQKVFYLFSFGTEEVRIISNNRVTDTFGINDLHGLLRWCRMVIPNDEYVQNLKN